MKLSISGDDGIPAHAVSEQPLFVLKFGSSVLRGPDDLLVVAGEIERHRRLARRVIAVVSAFAGATDQLIAEAAALSGKGDCSAAADLVSLGEERAAALLRITCERIGLSALICRPEEMNLRSSGSPMNARPLQLEPGALKRKLAVAGLVIVPGFIAIGEQGERTLLGRGGSDFSAIFLAGELGAQCVRLYKDVGGVFERDPRNGGSARRFSRIGWHDALRLAGGLIQSQALHYAAARQLPIEIEKIGGNDPTHIGAYTESVEHPIPSGSSSTIAASSF